LQGEPELTGFSIQPHLYRLAGSVFEQALDLLAERKRDRRFVVHGPRADCVAEQTHEPREELPI